MGGLFGTAVPGGANRTEVRIRKPARLDGAGEGLCERGIRPKTRRTSGRFSGFGSVRRRLPALQATLGGACQGVQRWWKSSAKGNALGKRTRMRRTDWFTQAATFKS